MHGNLHSSHQIELGDEPAIVVGAADDAPPDRRKVSIRWLTGTVLTGFTALFLIGGALFAAVEGKIEPTTPLSAMIKPDAAEPSRDGSGRIKKGNRTKLVVVKISTRQSIEVSTVTKQGKSDLIKKRPFIRVKSSLLPRAPVKARKAPAFNPMKIFSDASTDRLRLASDTIYSAKVDGKLTVSKSTFPLNSPLIGKDQKLTTDQIRQTVLRSSRFLINGAVIVAALPVIAKTRSEADAVEKASTRLPFRIVTENVSSIAKSEEPVGTGRSIEEVVVKLKRGQSFTKLLRSKGASEAEAQNIAAVFRFSHKIREIGRKKKIRIAMESGYASSKRRRPIRVSLYNGKSHLATAAVSDDGMFIPASAPPPLPAVKKDGKNTKKVKYAGPILTVYRSIYQTGYDQKIPDAVISDLIRILSFDIDFNARVKSSDSIEVFYSDIETSGEKKAEILHASITLNGHKRRYYRFRTPDDKAVDYYDDRGKSAKKFLMRKPVSRGIFRSSFGMRKHPILGYYRMHKGVDWKAKPGTPIMAAGDGVLKEVKWKAGYGRYIKIRHANGYESGYAHMRGWAKGIRAGRRVFQGQVIGFVGSTGLSTGPHLHYEVQVNKRHVDPMRIRLPRGRTLKGPVLATFEKERDHIDLLLGRGDDRKLASR